MQNHMKITLSHSFPVLPGVVEGWGGWGPREIINPCQASKAKQRACNAAESRDPLSPISRFYPTAQGFKTTDWSGCQMSDLSLCRTNMLHNLTQLLVLHKIPHYPDYYDPKNRESDAIFSFIYFSIE